MVEWRDRETRERLRQEVIAGCEAMADVYLAVEREYHPLEEEIERRLDGSATANLCRAQSLIPNP